MTDKEDNGLEKFAFEFGTEISLCSIAISLRRIADHFDWQKARVEREEAREAAAKAERKARAERMVNLNA